LELFHCHSLLFLQPFDFKVQFHQRLSCFLSGPGLAARLHHAEASEVIKIVSKADARSTESGSSKEPVIRAASNAVTLSIHPDRAQKGHGAADRKAQDSPEMKPLLAWGYPVETGRAVQVFDYHLAYLPL